MNLFEFSYNSKTYNKVHTFLESLDKNTSLAINEISDLSWSMKNARSFHLVGCCGTSGIYIFQFKFKKSNILAVDMIKITHLDKTASNCCRASWNYMV